jgi:hypothetical protein
MKVLVTGGTGFIGNYLVGLLVARGDKVTIVSRNPNRIRTARAGVKAAAWLPDLSEFDAVVNLAGESIFGKRWNAQQLELLRSTRLETTQRLLEGMAAAETKPKVFVSGSAVGFYGHRPGADLLEDSPAGDDFLAQLCVDWEALASKAEDLGVRTVNMRTGVVLGHDGGALAKMLPPFRMFVGGPVGNGRQVVPWIHEEDMSRAIEFAIDTADLRGPINFTAPNPRTMRDLARTIGKTLGRPSFFPVPAFALKLALGGVAAALLADQRVLPKRLQEAGFEFNHPDLEAAVKSLLQRYLIDSQV